MLDYIRELICEVAIMTGSDKKKKQVRDICCVTRHLRMSKLMVPE